jgi:hypothetical protein
MTTPTAAVRTGKDWLGVGSRGRELGLGPGVEDPVGHDVRADARLHHLVPRVGASPPSSTASGST